MNSFLITIPIHLNIDDWILRKHKLETKHLGCTPLDAKRLTVAPPCVSDATYLIL